MYMIFLDIVFMAVGIFWIFRGYHLNGVDLGSTFKMKFCKCILVISIFTGLMILNTKDIKPYELCILGGFGLIITEFSGLGIIKEAVKLYHNMSENKKKELKSYMENDLNRSKTRSKILIGYACIVILVGIYSFVEEIIK